MILSIWKIPERMAGYLKKNNTVSWDNRPCLVQNITVLNDLFVTKSP
jgi:hypothetical protein